SDSDNNSSSTKKNTTDNVTGVYKDGVYEGTGKGFRGNITVSVRIKHSKIVEIKLVKNEKDDSAYFNKAWNEVPYSIIAMQTANADKVDVVSGATYSSNGIMEAVRNALKKAVAKKDTTSNSNSNSNNSSSDNNNSSKDDDNNTDPVTPSEPTTDDETVYTGTAVCEPDKSKQFDPYNISLEIVVSSDGTVKRIQNITWDDDSMSGWCNLAKRRMPNRLLASGTDTDREYDIVSGATCSSKAMINAYKDAVSKIKK
ncbi:MAG: FMN-binding protein, partial [Anaerostipes hadrus]